MGKGVIQEKSVEFLINSIKGKLNGTDVPKYCWLIGAGCSVRSGIPTGAQLIELLKMEIFKREHIAGKVDFEVKPPFDYKTYEDSFYTYINEHNLSECYKKFLIPHETQIKTEVDSFDESNITTLIPSNRRSKSTKDANNVKENQKTFKQLKKEIYQDYNYGYYFRQYSESARERQIFVENVIEGKPTKYGYVCLANLIHNNYARTVFTTNFDDLINEALMAYFFKHSKVLAHSELSGYIDYRGKIPHIIKLHGDYMFSNIRNTTDEINNILNTLTEKLCDALIDGFGFIVVGYNGADYSIINKLEETKEKCGSSPFPLIWCDRKESKDLHWRVKHLLKETPNSFYVRIDGFDALMAKLETTLGLVKVDLEERAKLMQSDLRAFYDDVLKEPEIMGEVKEQLEKKRDYYKVYDEACNEKDDEKAIQLFKEAIDLNPTSYSAYGNWGWRLEQKWKIEHKKEYLIEAIERFKKAIDLKSDNSFAYHGWGWCLLKLAKDKGPEENYYHAIEKFTKAIEIKPDYDLAYENWASTMSELGSIKKDEKLLREGIELYKKSIELKPSETKFNNYGHALMVLSEITNEQKYLLEALHILKNGGEFCLYNLACTYSMLNDKENALDHLEKFFTKEKDIRVDRKYILNDEDFRNISHMPEFMELLNKYRPE